MVFGLGWGGVLEVEKVRWRSRDREDIDGCGGGNQREMEGDGGNE